MKDLKNRLSQIPLQKLILVTFILLVANFILLFLPTMAVYQPSREYSTLLGEKYYDGWGITTASMASFLIPVFMSGIPYIIAIIAFWTKKSKFQKLKDGTLEKPARFTSLKFAAIVNLLIMFNIYLILLNEIKPYVEYGAYAEFTFLGILNIICSLAFLVLLYILTGRSKAMLAEKPQAEASAEMQSDE